MLAEVPAVLILILVCCKEKANIVSERLWLIQGALNRAWVNLWPREIHKNDVKKSEGNPDSVKERRCKKPLICQPGCVVPVQDGAPDGQEGVVNGQGVGDTVVSLNLDRLYRETNQMAHYGHQLEMAHQPPWGCRNLQRVAERQMICVEVLRAAFVCGDSTLFCFVVF